MPHVRSVSTGVFVGAGSRYEEDAIAGASHFVEHMLFKGTEKRPEPQLISGAIESVGGVLNASTDREATIYYTKVALDHFDIALDVLVDMYKSPLFALDEIERERNVIVEELAMTYDQPDALADLLIDQALWPDQPMGRDIGGTRDSVRAITRQQLVDYHRRQYVPSNTVISVAGNVRHADVVAKVDALLGHTGPTGVLGMYPVHLDAPGVRVHLGHKRTDQAHLCLALDGVSGSHEDRYRLDMLNTVLGEGMTSRLFMELRERRGLAYDVHSSSMHYRDCGAVVVSCGVDTANVDAAIGTIVSELRRPEEDLTAEELSRAVDYAVGRLDLRLEDTRAVMSWLGGQELLRDEVRTPDEVVTELRKLTVHEVKGVAHRYLGTGALRMSVVGPYRSQARFERLLAV